MQWLYQPSERTVIGGFHSRDFCNQHSSIVLHLLHDCHTGSAMCGNSGVYGRPMTKTCELSGMSVLCMVRRVNFIIEMNISGDSK